MRSGIMIWMEAERIQVLQERLKSDSKNPLPDFIDYEGRSLNRKDMEGVYLPVDIDDWTRRKNGQWQCTVSAWHDRAEKCDCLGEQEQERLKKMQEAIKKCKKCDENGMVVTKEQASYCKCVRPYLKN